MAALEYCAPVSTFRNSKYSGIVASSATRSRTIGCFYADQVGTSQEITRKESWQNLWSETSEWWDNRPDKGTLCHPDKVRNKWQEGALSLGAEQKLFSKLATLDVQLGRIEGPGDELLRLLDEGMQDKALALLFRMDQQGIGPPADFYIRLMEACMERKCLVQAKQVHRHLANKGLECCSCLGECLVKTYVKCGSLEDAWLVFRRLSRRTIISWAALVSGYTEAGQCSEALKMYGCMVQAGVHPNRIVFVSLLKACGSIADLEEGKRIHADVVKYGYDSDLFVSTCLVDMYACCGSLMDAQSVFKGLSRRDEVLWNVMISAYVQQNLAEKALQLYQEMEEGGVGATARTFVSLLQACSSLAEKEAFVLVCGQTLKVEALLRGRNIHSEAWLRGHESNVFVVSTLISMYAKCGSMVDAKLAFDSLSQHNVVAWNAMLAAYVQWGEGDKALHLYYQMREDSISPNDRTFVVMLQACGTLAEQEYIVGQWFVVSLKQGKEIHAEARRRSCEKDIFVGSRLISMYARCGCVVDAQNVFNGVPTQQVVLWNAMIAAYVQHGQGELALQLYSRMLEEGVSPDDTTFVWVLQACSETGALTMCFHIHQHLISTGHGLSQNVANTLIHTYGKCARMDTAFHVFNSISQPNVVSWTALVGGYARLGDFLRSLECYEEMQLAGVKPDEVTFLSLLSACSHAGMVQEGVKYFESMSRDHGITPQIEHYVCMVDLLGRAGWFSLVEDLVLKMPVQPDLSLWLCLLGACRKYGNVVLGKVAFDCATCLHPKYPPAYVLMSNIYADAGMWECAQEVSELRQMTTWKTPGKTWIEHEQEVHTFVVGEGDRRHQQQEHLVKFLGKLSLEMEEKFPMLV